MSRTQLAHLMQETAAEIEMLRQEYRAEPLDDRLRGRLQAIRGAQNEEHARLLAKRARDAALTHFLSEWARGRILGKPTRHGLEAKILQTKSLIKMLRAKGAPKAQIKGQLARLAVLQKELVDLHP